MNPADWSEADEISDRIIELLNNRVQLVSGVEQILAGLLLGLLGFFKSIPEDAVVPDSLAALAQTASLVLDELIATGPQSPQQNS